MQASVEELSKRLRDMNLRLVTAESCTGGLIAAAMTSLPGSSDVFDCGFITYSNESKMSLLGVPQNIISSHGAVSDQIALAMARGALQNSGADIAVSVTGIAGPGGGNAIKPVGLVYIGHGQRGNEQSTEHRFTGNRDSIRAQATEMALKTLIDYLDDLC